MKKINAKYEKNSIKNKIHNVKKINNTKKPTQNTGSQHFTCATQKTKPTTQ